MKRKGLIFRMRSAVAALFGVAADDAQRGVWWEVDLLLVLLIGAFALGIAAWSALIF